MINILKEYLFLNKIFLKIKFKTYSIYLLILKA